ncbi:MAG: YfcC family protein [Saprospiraceae bacterium]
MDFRKLFVVPSPYTVLMLVIVLAAAATWLIPAGNYGKLTYDDSKAVFQVQTPDGEQSLPATQATLDELGISIRAEKFFSGDIRKPVAVPGTYHAVEAQPQGIIKILQAPIQGIYEAVEVILFVLIIGGFIGVMRHSGMFEAGVQWLALRLKGRESWLIIIMTSLMALGGTTFGMAEETMAFFPILVPIFLAAGYDRMVPLAVIFLGTTVGFMCSTTNPFAIIIASDAAGVNWMAGLNGRVIMLVITTAVCIFYTLRYAKKVKADPTASLVYDENGAGEVPPAIASEGGQPAVMNRHNWLLSILFAMTFVVMIVGVSQLGWWFLEMTTLFLAAAIIVGFIVGEKEKVFVRVFVKGAEELLGVAFIIGIARGVAVVLNHGFISDSLLHYASQAVEGMPPVAFIIALLFIFIGLTFFISSSSGMAVLTMPIIGPLGSVVGVPTEQIVNAYIMGMGLMSFVTPTALILPSLAMVNINYGTWLKFMWPLLAWLTVIVIAFLTFSEMVR